MNKKINFTIFYFTYKLAKRVSLLAQVCKAGFSCEATDLSAPDIITGRKTDAERDDLDPQDNPGCR